VTAELWVDALEARVLASLDEEQSWETPLSLACALDEGYVVRPHLQYLSDRLVQAVHDVEAGRSRYLLISLPPRTGKSQMGSVNLPTWVLRRHPDWPLMLLSHSPDLAAGWGRQIRRLVDEHPELGLEIADDAGAATEWETTEHGSVLSRSIRQSITGRGARVMILDDVVKDFADAHSKTNREFVWNWWTANSRTRLHPPALVIVLGTRWHEDDLIGRLQSDEYEGDPDQWEVISFPAIADHKPEEGEVDSIGREPGEPLLSPLIPDETPEQAKARWADIRQAVGSYAWSALFQQKPAPAEGKIFNNGWWNFWRPGDLPEAFDRTITSWDCAFKNTDDSDYVVGQLWGVLGADRYLVSQVRGRFSFTETLPLIEQFVTEATDLVPGGVHEHVVEDKANGTAVIDVLKTRVPGMIPQNPTESKEARARSVTPEIEAGNVFLPALADWLPDYLGEFKSFPVGLHDDQVDCTTQALLRLRQAGAVTPLLPTATISRGYSRGAAPAGRSRDYGTRRRA
jgi:predicted phage terminase large subunit-like protein